MRAFSFAKNGCRRAARPLPALCEIKKADGSSAGRIAIMTLSNLSLQALGFLYRMMLTKLAGSETLGLQSLVMQVYAIMASACIHGMNVAVTALAARLCAGSSQDGLNINSLFRAALVLFILLFAVLAAPLFIFRKSIAQNLIGDVGTSAAIVLVLLCILMTGIENILKSIHIATGHVGRTAVSELLEQGARFLIVMLLLETYKDGENSGKVALIVLGMLGSEFISVGFLLASFKRLFRYSLLSPGSGIYMAVLQLIPILAPACLTSVAGTVFEAVASLLLPGRLLAAGYTRTQALSAIGILNAAAIPLVMLPMAFVGSVSIVSMPMVSSACARGDEMRIRRIVIRCFIAAAAALVLINIPAIPYLGRITNSLFGLVPTKLCFILLTLKAGTIYFQVTARSVLNGLMKQRSVLLIAIIGEALQLVLIILLTAAKELHIYGYLIAGCVGEGVEFMIAALYLKKLMKKPAAENSRLNRASISSSV